MPPRSPTLAAAAALCSLVCAGAQAAPMCLKPGSLGPDVPDCTAYQDSPAAKTAIADNLLAISGQAAVENFQEREAIDAAGPINLNQASAAKKKAAASRAAALAAFGVAPTPGDAAAASLGKMDAQYDALARDIVRGTGDAFQALGQAGQPASAGSLLAGAAVTPAARAQSGSAGQAQSMAPGRQTSIGQLSAITDPGRHVFDQSAAGLPDDVTSGGVVAAPRAPTAAQCSILHPCSKAN